MYSGSSYRNYFDDRYYYEEEMPPQCDSRIPMRNNRTSVPYMDQERYSMSSYNTDMMSRASPIAMDSHRSSTAVMRPPKEERRERKESSSRSKSKRSTKSQRPANEVDHDSEPTNMPAIWQEIEDNRGKLLRMATHQTGCR